MMTEKQFDSGLYPLVEIKNNRKTSRGRKRQVIKLPNGRTKTIIHSRFLAK